jgi:predicted metal-dependent phosphoesterase TrpH
LKQPSQALNKEWLHWKEQPISGWLALEGETMGLADLHIHSIFSYDGTASVPAILARAKSIGLDVIAITDHDEIQGSLKALELASEYDLEVVSGIEVTTAEGDLLAFNVTEKIERGHSPIETILRVRELGGFCIAPHPMAGGLGMNSLSAYSIKKALHNPEVAQTLIGIETYNATSIDKMSNHYAQILGEHLGIAKLGNSDAHITRTMGLGMTEFPGRTARDLIQAIYTGKTIIHKKKPWNAVHILGSWAASYAASTFTRFVNYP